MTRARPMSRKRDPRDWRKALASAVLLHLVCISSVILLIPHMPMAGSAELAVELVFVDPTQNTATQAQPDQQMPQAPSAPLAPDQAPSAEASAPPPSPPDVAPPEQAQSLPTPPPSPPDVAAPERAQTLPTPPSPPEAVPPDVPASQRAEARPLPPRHMAPSSAAKRPVRQAASLPSVPAGSSPSSETTGAQAASAAPLSIAWQQALAAWLAEHKRYPEEARRRRLQGSVAIRFTIDRSGHVIDAAVVRSSGWDVLDSSALLMLDDAHLPAPPATTADRITITTGIRYEMAP